jgi:hypothetical protein
MNSATARTRGERAGAEQPRVEDRLLAGRQRVDRVAGEQDRADHQRQPRGGRGEGVVVACPGQTVRHSDESAAEQPEAEQIEPGGLCAWLVAG